MTTHDLGGPLLASVSRSFYLTIRILPAELREPIGLAYLLARASDTIADTADAPASVRLRHLAAFGEMIRTGRRESLRRFATGNHAPPITGNANSSRRSTAASLGWLRSPRLTAREIAAVMGKIIRGQTLDLERFDGGKQIVALQIGGGAR